MSTYAIAPGATACAAVGWMHMHGPRSRVAALAKTVEYRDNPADGCLALESTVPMTADRGTPRMSELALSLAWNDGRLPTPLRTVGGRAVEVVHRGTWTHGFGPDFRDAMLLLDGRELVTGDIELHLSSSAWREHGHHLDSRYNGVVLHVVCRHDSGDTRRHDGAVVPVVVVSIDAEGPPETGIVTLDWSRVGGTVCAEDLTRQRPGEVRAILWQLGDLRLAAKAARLEARLTERPPGEVFYQELCDGLGFAANRAPMRALATRLSLAAIEDALAAAPAEQRLHHARGLVFGVAGFLPLSPADAAAARLTPMDVVAAERHWLRAGRAWHDQSLSPTAWTRARARPTNHPALRLAACAAILANARGGLVATLLGALRQRADAVRALRDLARWDGQVGLGHDRATGLVANALLPFALALAEQTGDTQLADAASAAWEALPAAETNEVTRRALRQVAGAAHLTGLGARGQQGLIQLDTSLCGTRRCYECPIAFRVLAEDQS